MRWTTRVIRRLPSAWCQQVCRHSQGLSLMTTKSLSSPQMVKSVDSTERTQWLVSLGVPPPVLPSRADHTFIDEYPARRSIKDEGVQSYQETGSVGRGGQALEGEETHAWRTAVLRPELLSEACRPEPWNGQYAEIEMLPRRSCRRNASGMQAEFQRLNQQPRARNAKLRGNSYWGLGRRHW